MSSGSGSGGGGFRDRRGRVAAQRIRHQADGAVFDPGGLVGGGAVRLALLPHRLDAQQQRAGTPRLAHHGRGLGGAFQDARGVGGVFAGQPQAVQGLGVGGDELGGERHLLGVGGQQGGDFGDGGVVAADEIFLRVGGGRGKAGPEGVDDLVVHIPWELEGEVGRHGWEAVVHGGNMVLVTLSFNVITATRCRRGGRRVAADFRPIIDCWPFAITCASRCRGGLPATAGPR